MVTTNHTSNPGSRPGYSRVYWITPAGMKLLTYLDYVDLNPTVSQDIAFGEIGYPPEQFDDDRQPQPEDDERRGMHPENRRRLVELFEELAECQGEMIRPGISDSRYEELRLQVLEIRRLVAEIEGE